MASVYFKRASRPLVGVRTLRGSYLFEPGARAARASSLLGKGQGHLMPAIAAIVTRRGRAFSGAATTRVVGGVGRRTLPPAAALRLPRRDDGACAVMWPPQSWWAPLVNEGTFHLQLMRAGRVLRRARLAAYKSDRRRRDRSFTFALSVCCPCLLHSSPRAILALCASALGAALAFSSLLPRPFVWLPSSPSLLSTRRRGSARR
jgi:hypothetical protein